ncbi:MAG: lipoprotein NlpD, partial [Colwellia sp.]
MILNRENYVLLSTKTITYVVFLVLSLSVVSCSSNHKPAPVVDVQGSVPLSKRVKNSLKGREYIVKKGETLYSIAWRANVDISSLATFNNLVSPYKIFP